MKIAIAGFAAEGRVNYKYWSADTQNEITIVDENPAVEASLPEGVDSILGEGAFEKLEDFDLVVRTASLAPNKIKTSGKVWSATNEFLAECPAEIIGVTGTKGKGTVSSMIASILRQAGKKVWLVGNIGKPSLEILHEIEPDDLVVYELSSFQLWDIKKSPHISVVGMIEPDHLNIHDSMSDYVEAKSSIRRFQQDGDVCVYHPSNEYSKQIANSSNKGKLIRYGVSEDGGVFVQDDSFFANEQEICSVAALQLIGEHNVENACAALSVAKLLEINNSDIEAGLKSFKGLPHRLELVRKLDGVDYYNDSFASSPSATVAAIKSFEQPEIVIIGGVDKGADFTELAEEIKANDNIKEIVLIGEIKQKMADILDNSGKRVTQLDAGNMPEIVDYCRSVSGGGDVILLSPACASFDMFESFYDRGDQFRNYVNNL